MILRPETSLVGSVLALSGFFIENFPHISWYPYWYLGNPFSYLIGPVVPVLLFLVKRVFPFFALYDIYFGVIILSILIGGLGVYLFVKEWDEKDQRSRGNEVVALVSCLLYVLLPFSWLGLYYQSGLKHVAFAVIPFVFVLYRRFLKKDQSKNLKPKVLFGDYLLLVLLIAVCLLVTVNVLLPLIIGMLAIFFTVNRFVKQEVGLESKKEILEWREEKIVKTIVVCGIAISVATFWYTSSYWAVLLTNPSFGGVPLWNLIVKIFQYLLNFLPLVLAIFVVKWRFKRHGLLFGFLFFFSFLFLTAVRFLADPDFVIDWIGFLSELQFGLSIIGGFFVGGVIGYRDKLRNYLRVGIFIGLIAILLVVSGALVFSLFFYSKSEYQQGIISILDSHIKDGNARVFLSGSDVFWINSYLSLQQVRGGNDGASIHQYWSHGAYQIREAPKSSYLAPETSSLALTRSESTGQGEKEDLSVIWLRILGSSYVLVHQDNSRDPFHDFKHPEKFDSLELLADENGDQLYKVPGVLVARVVDRDLLKIGKPKNGVDEAVLRSYVDKFKKQAEVTYRFGDTIVVNGDLGKGEVVDLAVSYDPSWRVREGGGKITQSSLGNMVVVPNVSGKQEFVIGYERGLVDWLVPWAMVILSGLFLWRYTYIYPRLKSLVPKMHFGLSEEDEY